MPSKIRGGTKDKHLADMHIPRVSALVKAGGAFAPSDIAGMVFRYKATDVSGSDGSTVATWADSSGNGYDLTQATEGNKPLLQTNEVNGKNAIEFVSTDSMNSNAPGETKPLTFFAVLKPTNFTGYRTFIDAIGASGGMTLDFEQTTGKIRFLKSQIAVIGTSTGAFTANTLGALIVTYSSGGVYTFYIDSDTNTGTGTNNQTFVATTTRVGLDLTGAINYLGLICEMVKWDNVISAADITNLIAYARSEWGTP